MWRLGLAAAAAAAAATGVSGEIKVIGAGLGRTGTTSLASALTILGHKTYHMKDNIQAGDAHNQHWVKFPMGDPKAIDNVATEVLQANKYTATTDFPACLIYFKLSTRYPDAKVILSVRDTPKAWAKSVRKTIGRAGIAASRPPMKYVFPTGFVAVDRYLWETIGAERLPNGTLVGLEEAYTRWNNQVKATIPHDHLLIHNAKDGWEPLCKFLDVEDCPTTPYPHSNDGKVLATVMDVADAVYMTWPLLPCMVVAGVIVAIRACLRACCSSPKKKTA